MFTAIVGSVNLGEPVPKAEQTKVSCNSQHYLEHQTIHTLRVKKSHVSRVFKHRDKLHMAKTGFSKEVYE